jgi:cell division protease FtsH
MPEPQQNEQEKSPRSRSFGSFLLFLFILIVTLAVFGRSTLDPERQLTQDQYLWSLYRGDVESQEFRGKPEGSNLVRGRFKPPGEEKTARFEASFADVAVEEAHWRQVKAQASDYRSIAAAELQEALEGGWYLPFAARVVTGIQKPGEGRRGSADESAEEGGEPIAVMPPVATVSHLQVGVTARSQSAWTDTSAPPFPLPSAPGDIWLDVDLAGGVDSPDLAALVAGIEAVGVRTERINLDITTGRGSTWRSDTSPMMNLLIFAGPWILIIVVFVLFMRQMRAQGGAGGVMSFGRSRAQLYTKENHTNVTFDDVAGAEEAKSEVREIVEFLKNPGRFTRIGGRMPRGVLLVGPPGCGKTLLAKAIAGEAEVPFFSISGSDFVEMFVGVGASRVRDLFKQARDNSPCIIFLDEIDAVGRRRGSGMGGGHDEREQTLNAILVEMDGFSTDKGIIVLAATNRPDVLDPALLRPGRFDREVTIDRPDLAGRQQILGVHLKKVRHEKEAIDLEVIARSTPGYSGADLAAIVNEAAIMAVLDKREEVGMQDLEEARDKVKYGREKKSAKVEEEDRKITAYHEAGHAVIAALLPNVDHPHKVTIVPRGRALGATMMLPSRESYHMQKGRLLGQLVVLFGGRVAEQEFCGDISAGAYDDISKATDLARRMVTELGMSERIGPVNYAERQGSDFLGTELGRGKLHSEATAREIDEEIHKVLDEAYTRAEELIRENRVAIEGITEALMIHESVTGEEIEKLLGGARPADLRPAPTEPEPDAGSGGSVEAPDAPSGEGDLREEFPGQPGLSPA